GFRGFAPEQQRAEYEPSHLHIPEWWDGASLYERLLADETIEAGAVAGARVMRCKFGEPPARGVAPAESVERFDRDRLALLGECAARVQRCVTLGQRERACRIV